MFVVGVICNSIVGFMAARIPMIVIISVSSLDATRLRILIFYLAMGTLGTAGACILFALINPRATYWAFGFPATVLSVFGVDFVFTAGTLYNAKISLPHEQSLAAALFQTMVQVCVCVCVFFARSLMYVTLTYSARDICGGHDIDRCL